MFISIYIFSAEILFFIEHLIVLNIIESQNIKREAERKTFKV